MGDEDSPIPEALKRTREYEVPTVLGSKPFVLVVDDDWDICDAVKELLEDNGFEVACVDNGELAVRHLREHPGTSAVLLDLMMPLMNGWAVVDRLQSMPQLAHIPIVVMTAIAPHWGYPSCQVLRKPAGKNELLTAVRSAVARRRGTEAAG